MRHALARHDPITDGDLVNAPLLHRRGKRRQSINARYEVWTVVDAETDGKTGATPISIDTCAG
jgi:hypothetical protein